jgi:hypothetical protein
MIADAVKQRSIVGDIASLFGYVGLREEIVAFWLKDSHRDVDTWHDHQNINDVMLATALVPDTFATVEYFVHAF